MASRRCIGSASPKCCPICCLLEQAVPYRLSLCCTRHSAEAAARTAAFGADLRPGTGTAIGGARVPAQCLGWRARVGVVSSCGGGRDTEAENHEQGRWEVPLMAVVSAQPMDGEVRLYLAGA